jgi:hypothetical protein
MLSSPISVPGIMRIASSIGRRSNAVKWPLAVLLLPPSFVLNLWLNALLTDAHIALHLGANLMPEPTMSTTPFSFASHEPKGFLVPDLPLLSFIEHYADSTSRWDIVTYIAQHGEECLTARDVAQAVRQHLQRVRLDLEDLVLLGLLDREDTNGKRVYTLTQNPRLRRIAGRFQERFAPRIRVV